MIKNTCWSLLMVCLTHSPFTFAVDQNSALSLQHQLSPDEIQGIQVIGRSVLAAKHDELPNPDNEVIKQNLQTLRQHLDDLHDANTKMQPGVLILESEVGASSKSAQIAPQNLKENRVKTSELHVREQLESFRQQVTQLKSRHQSNVESETNTHSPHVSGLLDKSDVLIEAFDQALATEDNSARTQKLEALRERLKSKNLTELLPKSESAPTLSTLIRHRE